MKRWKSCLIVLVFIALTVFGMQTVFADESGKCGDNVTWTLDDAGTLTISGTGKMTDYYIMFNNDDFIGMLSPFHDREDIKSIIIENGVVSIGSLAFDGCSALSNITIPSGVTSIGNGAFEGCFSLTSITIPSSVTSIGDATFAACHSLTNITIPSGVISIGNNTFGDCSSLTSITIPSSVTSIGESAFASCHSLTSITIPSSLTSIGDHAFCDCLSLESITIPSSVSHIGDYAFSGCDKLTDIYYNGSDEEWNKIIFGTGAIVNNVTIHYNSTNGNGGSSNGSTSGINNDENSGNIDNNNELEDLPKYPIPCSYQGYMSYFDVHYFSKNKSPKVGNPGLATLSGVLSWAVYNDDDKEPLKKVLNKFGFSDSDIYEPGSREESFHYAIAKRQIVVDKKKYNLLLFCIRGTVTHEEAMGDHYTRPDSSFFGYNAYGLVYKFEKRIMEGLNNYCDLHPDIENLPLKVLITGHSLGGATANLLASRFIMFSDSGSWWAPLLSKEDIYAYTFASIDSIGTEGTVSSGFENIHNITNFHDSYGPDGWPVFTAAGNTRYGKFGHIDIFYSDVDQGAFGENQNHMMNTYMDAVTNGDPKRKVFYESSSAQKIASFHCPVDICVYKGDSLVAKVIDNKVVMKNANTPICVVGDEKYIALLDNGIYTFRITATGDGTMKYSVCNAGDGTDICTYENIELNDNKTFSTSVGNSVPAQEIKLYVTNDKGVNISEVQTNGSEKSLYDKPTNEDQIGGNSQTSGVGLTVGTTESSNGSQSEENTQPSSEGEPTTEAQPVTPETVQEPITISRTPSSVKIKVNKNKVTVSWKKIKKKLLSKIKNIQIQYSTDPTFNQNPVTKTIEKNKTEVILKLKKKTIYYIRLRYVGKDGFSNWSKVKKVKIK